MDVKKIKSGFAFKLLESTENKKVLSTQKNIEPTVEISNNVGSTAQCWSGYGIGDLK